VLGKQDRGGEEVWGVQKPRSKKSHAEGTKGSNHQKVTNTRTGDHKDQRKKESGCLPDEMERKRTTIKPSERGKKDVEGRRKRGGQIRILKRPNRGGGESWGDQRESRINGGEALDAKALSSLAARTREHRRGKRPEKKSFTRIRIKKKGKEKAA